MDVVKIESKFMKTVLGMALEKLLKKKFGARSKIFINDLDICTDDEGVHFVVNLKGHIPQEDARRIISRLM